VLWLCCKLAVAQPSAKVSRRHTGAEFHEGHGQDAYVMRVGGRPLCLSNPMPDAHPEFRMNEPVSIHSKDFWEPERFL
jgi:hypothetical protein